jgi:hypothetical protein
MAWTHRPSRRLPAWLGAIALLLTGLLAGCGTTKVSGTARTADEQLLLTNAWDDALRKVDFRPLAGVPCYLDPQYATSPIDQGWMISSIRQAMLSQGVLLKPKAEQAQWIVEARVGTYGTNEQNLLIGISQTTIPAVAGIPGGTVPEMPLAKRNRQQGVVKLALYAYDRGTGQVTWTSGTQLATSSAKDVYVGGLGPIQSGSIRSGTEFVGVRLPTVSDSSSQEAEPARGRLPEPSPLPPAATVLDHDSFAP